MEVWIGRDGERHGPYQGRPDKRQWLRSGQVSRDDLAWYEGLADWQPLSVLFPQNDPHHRTTIAHLRATAAAADQHRRYWKITPVSGSASARTSSTRSFCTSRR
jgi:hypothetical protein